MAALPGADASGPVSGPTQIVVGRGAPIAVASPTVRIGSRGWQAAARIVLAAGLVALGLYVLSHFLRSLVWAMVLGIALWPLVQRVRRRFPSVRDGLVVPAAFTALVAVAFLLPVVVLTFEAVREVHDLMAVARRAEEAGIPVPDIVARLPYGSAQVTEWWNANFSRAGWAHELARRIDTASNRELGRNVGLGALHRVVQFGFCLLALFFVFRDGDALIAQCRIAATRLFGARGERVGAQMIASIHGTVDGLVLVGLGEGVLLGICYAVAGVPHPILLAAFTAIAAMIPFGAPIAIAVACASLLVSGAVGAAIAVAVAGALITFVADHFIRPVLIGGTTRLPFLWVLLGILGGVEVLGLLGLFVGPAVMSALILLWRELAGEDESPAAPPPEPLP